MFDAVVFLSFDQNDLVEVDNIVALDIELDPFCGSNKLDQGVTLSLKVATRKPKLTERFSKYVLEVDLVVVFQLLNEELSD